MFTKFWGLMWPKLKFILSKAEQVLLILLAIFTFFIGYLYFKPVPHMAQPIVKAVSGDYSRALQEVARIQAKDDTSINPACHTKLLDHGSKQAKTIVMFHGFTNCPAQFDQLGQQLFDQGYNVYIPRIPFHGLQNRLTHALENLTAQDLTNEVAESVDIATGLGKDVTLFGISGGSVMASWGGYVYPEVKHVFIGAPLFSPATFKFWQMQFSYNLLDNSPSAFAWWDEETKADVPGPSYAYPQYSFKAVKAYMQVSLDLYRLLDNHAIIQEGKRLVLLTVENDPAINNSVARDMVERWATHPGTLLIQYQIPSNISGIHDFIDPNQTKQNIKQIYPIVIDLLQKNNV